MMQTTMIVVRDFTPCSLVHVHWNFRESFYLNQEHVHLKHLQIPAVSRAPSQHNRYYVYIRNQDILL